MSIDDYIEKFRRAKREFIAAREAETLGIALDQIALMKRRIQTTGIQADGTALKSYSLPYAKTRVKKGYQVGFVDYTVSGRFFASIVPVVTERGLFSTTIEILPNNERGQTILNAAARRNGKLLTANSLAELELVKKWNRERITKRFDIK